MLSTVLLGREKEREMASEPVLRAPLESAEAVKAFDAELNDASREALIVELTSFGSLKVGKAVKAMLAFLMTDQAASEFSMDGRKGKEKFRKLKLAKVIHDAVRRTKHLQDATKDEVENEVKEWLRRGKERNAAK
ncbi:uncharacterized protein ISCGN_020899 [Ixodes scapularis]